MEKQNEKKRQKKKIVLRPSPMLLKIVLTVLIVFSIGALGAIRWVHLGLREQIGQMRQEAAGLELANEDLEDRQDALGTARSVEDIAKEKLGLVDPNTVLITPVTTAAPETEPED